MDSKESGFKNYLNADVGIFVLAIAFLSWIPTIAFEDRLVLILYYLAAVGSAYTLVKRRAIRLASVVICVVAATTFVQLYHEAGRDSWNPVFDAFRETLGLGALIYLTIRLLMLSYKMQADEKKRVLQNKVEERLVAMRAGALFQTSHEVRTPLSTITAISETLLDGSTGQLTDNQREFVGDIDEAAKHLLDLVNDVLDYAKAEAGMIRIAPQPVALVELVNQCVTMVGPRANAAGVRVTAQVAPSLGEVVSDPLRLRQILLNLLSNAIKYNCDGGSVNIRIRPDDNETFRISVRDTGRGISPEHLEHLFEPYYQAATVDQGIGTGLGLAIIKHLTELHGGKIEVESVVGTGSLFTVQLPIKAEAVVSDEAVSEPCQVVHPDLPLDLVGA